MHEPGENGGRFVIQRDGRDVAQLVYTARDGIVNLVHTEVDPVMRGSGAGKALVAEAVQWVRTQQKRLVASCPYARSVLDRTPEYHDVLAQGPS